MSTLKDFQGLSVYILRFLDTYSEAIRRGDFGEGTQRHTQIKNIFFICERYNILDLFDKRTNKEKYLAYINLIIQKETEDLTQVEILHVDVFTLFNPEMKLFLEVNPIPSNFRNPEVFIDYLLASMDIVVDEL